MLGDLRVRLLVFLDLVAFLRGFDLPLAFRLLNATSFLVAAFCLAERAMSKSLRS